MPFSPTARETKRAQNTISTQNSCILSWPHQQTLPVKQASTRLASKVLHREAPEQKAVKVPCFPSLCNAPKMKSTSKLISLQQNIGLLTNRRVILALTKNLKTYHTKSRLSHRTKPSTPQCYHIWSPQRIQRQLDRFGTNIALCVTEIT